MISTKTLVVSLLLLILASAALSGCTAAEKEKGAGGGAGTVTETWNLTLAGTSEKVLSLDDLRKYPAVTGHGYAVSTTGIRFGPYMCTGVDLRDLVADAGGMGPGDQVWISAPDGYMWVFDTDQLAGNGFVTFDADLKEIASPPLRIILMYEQDRKPVSYDDGGPARIAIISDEPGIITEGSAWVKWVNRIEIHRK